VDSFVNSSRGSEAEKLPETATPRGSNTPGVEGTGPESAEKLLARRGGHGKGQARVPAPRDKGHGHVRRAHGARTAAFFRLQPSLLLFIIAAAVGFSQAGPRGRCCIGITSSGCFSISEPCVTAASNAAALFRKARQVPAGLALARRKTTPNLLVRIRAVQDYPAAAVKSAARHGPHQMFSFSPLKSPPRQKKNKRNASSRVFFSRNQSPKHQDFRSHKWSPVYRGRFSSGGSERSCSAN
jgi:hypothetical protein